ncbi:NAD-dependent epimerase/dehydratase family protein [Mucilaginibacter sp.]
MDKKIKVIVTGATGMVGEGVMHECLLNPQVEQVLIVNRKSSGFTHPKLKEIIHADFFDVTSIADQLAGYDACYFCLGVSSVGMKEPEYYKLTYMLTINFAETLVKQNAAMEFCYISGANTDSTEKGSSMWARVKGKTENDLMKLPFKSVYNFRPGGMLPTKGLKNTLPYYKYFIWLYPIMRKFFPKTVSTLAELGQAMINSTLLGYDKHALEVMDIVKLAHEDEVKN